MGLIFGWAYLFSTAPKAKKLPQIGLKFKYQPLKAIFSSFSLPISPF